MEMNGIPLLAIFIEGSVGLFMLFLSIRGIVRYYEKKTTITYYLMFAMFAWSFAALHTTAGKFLDYTNILGNPDQDYTSLTIGIAYSLLTLGNIFFTVILKNLYLDEESLFPLVLHIANGILIGLILSRTSTQENVYDQLLPYLIIFIILTILIHGSFFRYSLREARQQDQKIGKVGFFMIGGFSASFLLVIVFFLADLIVGIIQSTAYTPYYYLAWLTVGISTLFGFLGFIMPPWFRNLIKN